jgi:Delta3,5-Delta2,4-dienoyl-CoA isomerase
LRGGTPQPWLPYFLLPRPTLHVVHVEINRPSSKLNAFFEAMWIELRNFFGNLSQDSSVRVVILSGSGEKAFTTGLDVQAAAQSRLVAPTDGRVPHGMRWHFDGS